MSKADLQNSKPLYNSTKIARIIEKRSAASMQSFIESKVFWYLVTEFASIIYH